MNVRDNANYNLVSLRKATRHLSDAMKELSTTASFTEEQMAAYLSIFDQKKELMERLNIRLKGGDPGEPFNWRGEAGIR